MRRGLALAAGAVALAGCASQGEGAVERPQPPSQGRANSVEHAPRSRSVEPVRCPGDATGCRSATGEIVYVERVDPDGDGDAHFVLLGDDDVTGPGISVVDVSAELRPRPLPGPGDLLSAAGPVRTGSYGQRQIEAVEVRVARP